MPKFLCTICGFEYDPAEGLPAQGIPPGTPFEDLPETFECPICSAGTADFEPVTEAAAPASADADVPASVQAVVRRTPTIISLRLACPALATFHAGQHVVLTLEDNPRLTRPLSISSSPSETGVIEVTKRITGSDFSHAFQRAQIGQQVTISRPRGDFVLDAAAPAAGFIAGGIGITPLLSMSSSIIDAGAAVDVCLLYCNRSREEIAFHGELDRMAQCGIKVVHTLTRAGADWNGRRGRIDAGLVRSEVPSYAQRCFYVCGPGVMVDAMTAMLHNELGLSQEQIRFERFLGY